MIVSDLKITLVQSSLAWEDKKQNLSAFSQKLSEIKDSTDLVVLPEMFNTGFTMNAASLAEDLSGETMNWLMLEATKNNCVITGSFIVAENDRYYNRLVWMCPDGSYKCYDKRHLFRMAKEDQYYSAGNKRLIVELNGWKICPLICYDLRFPVWSRNRLFEGGGSPEYDVLLYLANWPERRSYAWKQLLIARAIENQAFVAGVNRIGNDGNEIGYSGDTMLISPAGEVMSTISPSKDQVQTISLSHQQLNDYRVAFPVALDADDFELKV